MARQIIILGGPQVGKTTLAETLSRKFDISTVHRSSDLEGLEWSESSEAASKWFSEPGDWICEGVQMARALRRWLKANPTEPLDADILTLESPLVPLLPGQVSMQKGVETVFQEIEAELAERGGRIHKLKHPDRAKDIWKSAVPTNSDAKAVPMALKRKLSKEDFDQLEEAQKAFYKEQDGSYLLDLEAAEGDDEDSEKVKALKKQLDDAYARRDAAVKETEKFKDVDPEKYRQLVAAEEERARDSKKKSGDWEGWKQTFLEEEARKLAAKDEEITSLRGRINTFLLDNKIAQAALEAGVRKKLIPHVVRNTKDLFRLDKSENIEVLDDRGNPISVTVEAFFKDKYVQEFPEYYEPTGSGGSGAPKDNNGSRGSARVISVTDQAALNANLADIASGKAVVQ